MASTGMSEDGPSDGILRPRAVRPVNPQILRAQSDHGLLKPGEADNQSAISSGRSTPVPLDAPPSVQSISSARKQIRAREKQRMFPTVDYAARLSHFDPDSEYRDFRGFFSLFWIGLAIMVITTGLRNIKDTGFPFQGSIWTLLVTKVWQLGLVDFGMVASTALALPLHRAYRSGGWLAWRNGGMAIQSLYQLLWSIVWLGLPFHLQWTWTAQVFLTLHTMTFFMKMHSYAFYNGHLSETENRLSSLDSPEGASTASAYHYPRTGDQNPEQEKGQISAQKMDADQILSILREDLATELTSPLGRVTYPQNLTCANFADFLLCPTLCYELEYPRTERVRPLEVFAKSLAVFGVIFLMINISEEYILPVLQVARLELDGYTSPTDRGLIVAEAISNILFPFMISFLLTFLVIFEYGK
ncbi:MAG: hypothetical protein M1814_003311 [Vezdaea aestivalis]|nr:MAG: hypothetical protein M1814_003311 [Vezdaea aestivalis]